MIISGSFYRSERGFALKRFDSFIIYKALFDAEGLGRVCSYEDVANALTIAGLSTRRGGRFTARVVRVCLKEIEDAGLVALEPAQGGFRLRLVADPYKGATLFDDGGVTVSETETEIEAFGLTVPKPCAFEEEDEKDADSSTETETETELVDDSSCININTQEIEINKRARVRRASRNTKNTKYRNTNNASVDQAVASVDVDDAEGRALRRKLVEIVWEPSLRPDLIDRAVAAVKLGLARSCELLTWARRALDVSRGGTKKIWQTFALDVKAAFDACYDWTPTRPGKEPAPTFAAPRRDFSDDGDDSERVFVRNGRVFFRAAF